MQSVKWREERTYRMKRTTHVFVICTTGLLLLALSGTATAADKKNPGYTEMTEVVRQALVRELGTSPDITSVSGKIAAKYS